uniref:TPR_REGION domain-containing protein n=1 Tax=Mesocestoides corti TaxID=53468 RepID=A0A5K3FKW2_MESCO
MNEDNFTLSTNLAKIKHDLCLTLSKCQVRGLVHSAAWLAELSLSIQNVNQNMELDTEIDDSPASLVVAQFAGLSLENFSSYSLAKCYFDTQEYARCARVLSSVPKRKSYPLIEFLFFYSQYMGIEKHRTDDAITIRDNISSSGNGGSTPPSEPYRKKFSHLKSDMEFHYTNKRIFKKDPVTTFLASEVDVYTTYVYALVLVRLGFQSLAITVLSHILKKDPLWWPAWSELVALVEDREQLDRLFPPPNSDSIDWMTEFFRAKALLRLQESERALSIFKALSNCGFQRSLNLQADIAEAHDRLRDLDSAMEQYKKIFSLDPCRLTDTDIYSNILFVKAEHDELAYLARRCAEIDKYRPQTCCVLGNFYGLRSQHDKAVLYFQRALRLQPRYALVWILIGHEYVELQHLKLAIYAYNQAIIHNRHDHRAWYGLGQLYEFIKQPEHALYYYQRAQYLCPTDSRMIVALGEMYEKLGNIQAATKCFWRAYCVGDVEGGALTSLARCFEKSGEFSEAAAAHTLFIRQCESRGVSNEAELGQSYRYLANYHLQHGHYNDAVIAVNKCLDFPEIREEAKSLCLQLTLLSGSVSLPAEVKPPEVSVTGTPSTKAQEHAAMATRLRLKARRRLKHRGLNPSVVDYGESVTMETSGLQDFPSQSDDADLD